MTASIQSFFELAKMYHPALRGDTSLPFATILKMDQDNTPMLRALYQHWQEQSPEAGHRYWAARCWTLLIWQPIYLSIVAVHGYQTQLPLEQLTLHLQQGVVTGYSLTQEQWLHTSKSSCLSVTAQQLKRMHQTFFNQCQRIFKFRPNLASRLSADTLLTGLIRLSCIIPSIRNEQIQELATLWLNELSWQDESALMSIPLKDHTQQLALDRKSCCFNYCCSNGSYCSTCPKLSLDERKRRITQELSSHA